ncbi:MAG: septum formation protein Maf [Planctomycetes bacterium]|nr:septum formation protein Maf [Planctomycetota bacterium]
MGLLSRKVVLASGSPYRAQILRDVGVEFAVIVSDVDESLQPKAEPVSYARDLATRKAQAVATRVGAGKLVIAADTICAIDGDIIGKPADEDDARRMIKRSCTSGLQRVITGVCVIETNDMQSWTFDDTSLVEMKDAPDDKIAEYVASGEPMGKCGALCIESGQSFVKSWRGSYANIMGLPIERLLPLLFKLDA